MRSIVATSLVALALAACGNAAGSALETPRAEVRALAPLPRGALVINEVAAAGQPDDWFEVVNATDAPIDLSDFVFVDAMGAVDRARAFPDLVLQPGERHVQSVTAEVAGFQLASDEALWIYRAADAAVADGVEWPEGASPTDGSFARVPDVTGAFTTRCRDTQGEPNS